GRRAPLVLDVVGLLALAALLRQFMVVGEFEESLYQGGFLRLSLLATVVLAVVAHPAARLGRALGFSLRDLGPLRALGRAARLPVPDVRPLLWIGLRSYSIYLWHWPVFMVTRPQQDIALDGLPLLALRL